MTVGESKIIISVTVYITRYTYFSINKFYVLSGQCKNKKLKKINLPVPT